MPFGKKKNAFSRRRRGRGLLNHRLLLGGAILAVAALVLLGQFGETGFASFWKLRGEEAQLRQEVDQLEAANADLDEKLEAVASDPEALEKLAREKHNMRRADEEVLTVLDRTGKDVPESD